MKVLDFGLQRPTGPILGAVAGILLVSLRLDYPGMNLAEVYSTGMEMSMWSFSGQYDFEVFELHHLLVPTRRSVEYWTGALTALG